MTTEHEASRTLVKSPPELWAECSDAGSLARHLGEFGEIKITRLEPESTVAWEGEHVSGTVRIEPSGWGTRVTLTAETKAADPGAEAAMAEPGQVAVPGVPLFAQAAVAGETPPDVESLSREEPTTAEEASDATVEATLEDPVPVPVDDTGRPRGRWRRITARMRAIFGSAEPVDEGAALPEADPESELTPEPEPEPEPEAVSVPDPDPVEPDVPEPDPLPQEPELDAEAILVSALDSLGQAHHRPFSRA